MVKFLSPEWAESVTIALNDSTDIKGALKDVELTLQQIVTGGPDGEVTYWTRFVDGYVEGGVGDAPEPDVTITQDYETAVALARDELNAQSAFMQGKLKVKGNMGKLLQNQSAIQALGPVMASVQTEY
ncbi:MAG: SCP2 sterol-binding domain-containing protein [Actinomycetota bacterium]